MRMFRLRWTRWITRRRRRRRFRATSLGTSVASSRAMVSRSRSHADEHLQRERDDDAQGCLGVTHTVGAQGSGADIIPFKPQRVRHAFVLAGQDRCTYGSIVSDHFTYTTTAADCATNPTITTGGVTYPTFTVPPSSGTCSAAVEEHNGKVTASVTNAIEPFSIAPVDRAEQQFDDLVELRHHGDGPSQRCRARQGRRHQPAVAGPAQQRLQDRAAGVHHREVRGAVPPTPIWPRCSRAAARRRTTRPGPAARSW